MAGRSGSAGGRGAGGSGKAVVDASRGCSTASSECGSSGTCGAAKGGSDDGCRSTRTPGNDCGVDAMGWIWRDGDRSAGTEFGSIVSDSEIVGTGSGGITGTGGVSG